MAERIEIIIDGNSQPFTKALQSAERRLNTFNTKVTASNRALTNLQKRLTETAAKITDLGRASNRANTALGKLTSAATGTATSMRAANRAVDALARRMQSMAATMALLNGASKSAAASLARVGASGTSSTRSIQTATRAQRGMVDAFRQSVVALSSFQTLFYQYAFFLGGFVASLIKINSEYETMQQLLKNLSKASTDAGKAMEAKDDQRYLWDLAANAPFTIQALTDSFIKFKVAGIDPTNGSLQSLVDSVAAFGGNSEQLKRASIAIQQMAGKGVVSMEELRQQLGEAVPDAMQIMSRSMNMGMADFVKRVSKGEVESKNALRKMLDEMRRVHGGAATTMMNTWSGLLARMTTAYSKFVINVNNANEGGFFKTLKDQLNELNTFLNTKQGMMFAQDVSEGLATIVKGLADMIRFLWKWRDEIIAAVKIALVFWIGNKAVQSVAGLGIAFFKVGTPILKFISIMTRVTMANNSVALATRLLNSNLRSLAGSFGIAASSGAGAARGIGMMALRAAGAIGIVLALAAAVWTLVNALNARNAAEQRKQRIDKANKTGGVVSEDDLESEKKAVTKRRNTLESQKRSLEKDIADFRKKAGNDAPLSGYLSRRKQRLDADISAFNSQATKYRTALKNFNDDEQMAAINNFQTKFQETIDRGTRGIQTKYQNQLRVIDEEREKLKLSGKYNDDVEKQLKAKELAAQKDRDQRTLEYQTTQMRNLREKITKGSAAERAAATEALKRLETEHGIDANLTSMDDPNSFLAGKGEGKDKKNKKDESDGLDGLRNRWISLKVSIAETKATLDGTIDEFDSWDVEEPLRNQAELIASEAKLRDGIGASKDELRRLKLELKTKEAYDNLLSDVAQQAEEAAAALAEYKDDYSLINNQVARFQDQQNKRYRDQLNERIVGAANAAKFRAKIEEETHSLATALIAKEAKQFKDKNEEIKQSEMSEDELREHLYNKERERVLSLLQLATLQGDKTREQVQDLQDYLRNLETENVRRKAGPIAEWARAAQKDMNNLKYNMGNSLANSLDGFVDALSKGKLAFKQFTLAVISDLAKIIIRAMIAKVILSALGLGGGFNASANNSATQISLNSIPTVDTSGFGAGTMHTGGVVGKNTTSTKLVDPGMFNFAKRFHKGGFPGLGANEVPIIAEKGEGVFTKEQMKALGSGSAPNVEVNIINQTGMQTDAEKKAPRFDGEKWVTDIILKKMKTAGPVRDHLEGMRKR